MKAADAEARTFLTSKRQPTAAGTHLRTRAERRAEAHQIIAGRDLTKLNVREFARVREIMAIPTQAGLTGSAARRTYLGQVREFLGPAVTLSPSSE